MRIGIVCMPIQILIGINMEIRIRISTKTMPIHNTDFFLFFSSSPSLFLISFSCPHLLLSIALSPPLISSHLKPLLPFCLVLFPSPCLSHLLLVFFPSAPLLFCSSIRFHPSRPLLPCSSSPFLLLLIFFPSAPLLSISLSSSPPISFSSSLLVPFSSCPHLLPSHPLLPLCSSALLLTTPLTHNNTTQQHSGT